MPPQVVHAPHKCAPALLALGCFTVGSIAALQQAGELLSLFSLLLWLHQPQRASRHRAGDVQGTS